MLRFAIAATFTAEPLLPALSFWSRQLHTRFDIRFAPYNQLHQTLLDPASVFGTNAHGVNIVLARTNDLGDTPERVASNIDALLSDLRGAARKLQVPLIVCLCPSERLNLSPVEKRFDELERDPATHFLHYKDVLDLYPVDIVHDPEGDRLGKIPYTEAFYCALATALVRRTDALIRPPFKAIALDCDNTLWNGICGEDGPEGVTLDPPRRVLQEFMLAQRDAGMLLTLASKNNEDDVLETLRVHPDMPLREEHFVARRLNWETKPDNLFSIAEQLGLAPDSFIFIDDNPKECAEVEEELPEVLTLPLPEPIEGTPQFLGHVWAFDHPVVTDEDRQRSEYYARNAEYANEVRRAGSLGEFLRSLNLRVTIAPMTTAQLPRAAQLTQRTNQFNLTTIRRTEADLEALDAEILTAEVSDRFGDYGLVGLILLRASGVEWRVDTMLLSCRALGRGVEHRMLAHVGQAAVAGGIETVVVPYERTAKNAPACRFLESLRIGTRHDRPNGFVLHIPAHQLADLQWKPTEATAAASPKPVNPTVRLHRRIDYARIAKRFSTVDAILTAMRSENRGAASDSSMTEIERRLAGIWSDLLERPHIKRTDNFFDLGGHSLLAVLLLLRIREGFGVELSIDDVYSGSLTLADLASRIEAAQLGGVDAEEYAALLAEIESLSDEQVRELLARESDQA